MFNRLASRGFQRDGEIPGVPVCGESRGGLKGEYVCGLIHATELLVQRANALISCEKNRDFTSESDCFSGAREELG